MTTIYDDYYSAIQAGALELNNVSFLAMLTDDTYLPMSTDKLDDVEGVIVSVPFVIVGKDIVTLTMTDIIDKSINEIFNYANTYILEVDEKYRGIFQNYSPVPIDPDELKTFYIVMFSQEQQVLCFAEPITELEISSLRNGR